VTSLVGARTLPFCGNRDESYTLPAAAYPVRAITSLHAAAILRVGLDVSLRVFHHTAETVPRLQGTEHLWTDNRFRWARNAH